MSAACKAAEAAKLPVIGTCKDCVFLQLHDHQYPCCDCSFLHPTNPHLVSQFKPRATGATKGGAS